MDTRYIYIYFVTFVCSNHFCSRSVDYERTTESVSSPLDLAYSRSFSLVCSTSPLNIISGALSSSSSRHGALHRLQFPLRLYPRITWCTSSRTFTFHSGSHSSTNPRQTSRSSSQWTNSLMEQDASIEFSRYCEPDSSLPSKWSSPSWSTSSWYKRVRLNHLMIVPL